MLSKPGTTVTSSQIPNYILLKHNFISTQPNNCIKSKMDINEFCLYRLLKVITQMPKFQTIQSINLTYTVSIVNSLQSTKFYVPFCCMSFLTTCVLQFSEKLYSQYCCTLFIAKALKTIYVVQFYGGKSIIKTLKLEYKAVKVSKIGKSFDRMGVKNW